MAKKVIKMVLDTDLSRYGMKMRSDAMGFSRKVLSINEDIARRLVSEGRAEFFERKPKRFVNIISGGKTETVSWGEYLKTHRR